MTEQQGEAAPPGGATTSPGSIGLVNQGLSYPPTTAAGGGNPIIQLLLDMSQSFPILF